MREGDVDRKRDPDMERDGSREKFVFNASSTALCTSVSIMPSVLRSRRHFLQKEWRMKQKCIEKKNGRNNVFMTAKYVVFSRF